MAISFVASALPDSAHAQDADRTGLDLEWSAPDGCPDGASARKALNRYLGEGGLPASTPVVVHVELTPLSGEQWQGRVALHSDAGNGERVFTAPSCAQVADAANLVVAIMLDPLRVTAHVEALRDTTKAPETVAIAPESRPSLGFELGLQMAGDLDSLSAATLGIGVVAGLRVGRGLIEVAGTDWLPQRVFGGPSSATGGKLGLYTGSVRGCFDGLRAGHDAGYDAGYDRLGVGPCARVELGVATGKGFGLDQPVTTSAPWGAVFAGVTAHFSASPLSSWLSLEIGSPFVRPVYTIEGFGTVFAAPSVLWRVSSGVAWIFP